MNLTTTRAIAQEIVIMKRTLIAALLIIAGYQGVYAATLSVTTSVVASATQQRAAQIELATR